MLLWGEIVKISVKQHSRILKGLNYFDTEINVEEALRTKR